MDMKKIENQRLVRQVNIILNTILNSNDIAKEVQNISFKEIGYSLSEYPSIICFLVFLLDIENFKNNQKIILDSIEKYLNLLIESINKEYKNDVSLIYGLQGVLRVLNYCSEKIYSASIKKIIFSLEDIFLKNCYLKLDFCKNNKDLVFEEDYDILQGIYGCVLYYLDKRQLSREEKEFIFLSRNYLQDIIFSKENNEINLIIKQDCMVDNSLKSSYPFGYTNLGISHGILGPCLVFAKMFNRFKDDACLQYTRSICNVYIKNIINTNNLYFWPQRIDANLKNINRNSKVNSSWCLGVAGISRVLNEISEIINDVQLKRLSEKTLETLINFPIDEKLKNSNAICHGNAGLALSLFRMYQESGNIKWKKFAYKICERILNAANINNKYVFVEKDYYCKGHVSKSLIEYIDLSLLSGNTGIFIVLIGCEIEDFGCLSKLFLV